MRGIIRRLFRQPYLTGVEIIFLIALLLASALAESRRAALACGAFAAVFIALKIWSGPGPRASRHKRPPR